MYSKPFTAALWMIVISCQQGNSLQYNSYQNDEKNVDKEKSNPWHSIEAIPLPADYTREQTDSSSFAAWLRKQRLKKDKTVYLFNGDAKQNQQAQFAVLDISVGGQNLQQCADAVMRLRAEYLFAMKRFDQIVFTDNANTRYAFTMPYTKEHLHRYLQKVFGMCGSASLSKQLHKKNIGDIAPGDVLIRGGFPGHAAIVMDVAINKEGKKIFMLAQSYMPAQDIHVLVNPRDEKLSPWYEIEDEIISPEYVFTKHELKSW
jgi:hypothetical protein